MWLYVQGGGGQSIIIKHLNYNMGAAVHTIIVFLVLNSVKVQYFEVRGQCRIYGPYQWHRSHDPLFYGMVTGGHIMLTGRQRFNGL